MRTLSATSGDFFALIDMSEYWKRETAESDKRCLENSLKQFLASGKKEDAFSVYFCFSEIFRLFGSGYENTKKLLETLSDHEYYSGELLAKHRDHYSHSVYVFALGLAIYANDRSFRKCYLDFYRLEEGGAAAFRFLRFWGMTALFHDIGYPFQLAHEQIKAYTEEVWEGENNNLYVSYGNLGAFISFDDRIRKMLATAFPEAGTLPDCHELLAYGLMLREGYDPHAVSAKLTERVVCQPGFMDHGYFSAVILAKRLLSAPQCTFDIRHLDVLTAILLHNSFNKYDAPGKHPIRMEEHPLAYLLILCDELQCWDRLAYGKISKRDPLAWEIGLEIADNFLSVLYTFDSFTTRVYRENGDADEKVNENYKLLRDGVLLTKLHEYILSQLQLTVNTKEKRKPRKTKIFASDENFISLCDFAKAIHISYNDHCRSFSNDFISEDFGALDLEFKLSNIEQAKSYSRKLDLIHCFYSSKELDFPVVEDFNDVETGYKNNLGFLCREEHVRWVREKLAMGWRYGTDYSTKEERNRKKIHKDIVPYDMLSREEQAKDELMVNNIICLLRKFDSNIKIYNCGTSVKPALEIAGTGHRFLAEPQKLKTSIKEILGGFAKRYHVTVRTCFAIGADQLIAECAAELGLPIKAILPLPMEEYIASLREDAQRYGKEFSAADELRMRHLLAQTVVCKEISSDDGSVYETASRYIVEKCDKLLALWDGIELPLLNGDGAPINRGGTYDCIRMAREQGKETIFVACHRG